jgi:hypothetical protein
MEYTEQPQHFGFKYPMLPSQSLKLAKQVAEKKLNKNKFLSVRFHFCLCNTIFKKKKKSRTC